MSNEGRQHFSRRRGYSGKEAEITVREDAPQEFRAALLQISRDARLIPSELRSIACHVLRTLPDPNSWSEYPNVWYEVQDLVLGCDWYRVYDITEAIYQLLLRREPEKADQFEEEINEYFREDGIGWQLVSGEIQTRGPEAFESSVRTAVETLTVGYPTATNEIHEARRDLSRRPEADVTGAIQHAMAALECVFRDVCGDSRATLGDIVKRYPDILPKPLDEAVSKVWGYTSERGRHLREGCTPGRGEAELVVGLAATIATYLANKVERVT